MEHLYEPTVCSITIGTRFADGVLSWIEVDECAARGWNSLLEDHLRVEERIAFGNIGCSGGEPDSRD